MKCGLVQILAVAMVLGQTVSMDAYGFLPKGFIRMHELITGEPVSGVTKVAELATSGKVRIVDTLYAEVYDIIEELDSVNFEQFQYINEEEVYTKVNKLLEIRELVKKSTHDNDKLLKKLDNKISHIIENLQNSKQNIRFDIAQNYLYYNSIKNTISKIYKTSSLDKVNILLIHEAFKRMGIDFGHINEHLPLGKMINELEKVKDKLEINILAKQKIQNKIDILLLHIDIKKPIQITKQDTRDTQSMRNVISISIAVCAIVTLCIVLLIAVRNKHRTNAGVRLLNWV